MIVVSLVFIIGVRYIKYYIIGQAKGHLGQMQLEKSKKCTQRRT